MSDVYNAWCSMSGEFKSELWGYVRRDEAAVAFPEINDIDDRTKDFFNQIYDEGAVERLFKEWQAAGRTYKLWSFYSTKPDGTQVIKSDLEMLAAAWPQDFGVLGAWRMDDGTEVGDPVWFPIPNQTINFMPDVIVDNTDPENPVYGPATELTDVNLLMGQLPRSFASYSPGATGGGNGGCDV